jgi:hypothetical protein
MMRDRVPTPSARAWAVRLLAVSAGALALGGCGSGGPATSSIEPARTTTDTATYDSTKPVKSRAAPPQVIEGNIKERLKRAN